jgi:uncharacterized protein
MTISTEMAVNAKRIDFTSKVNGKNYRLFISVPAGDAPEAGWPVVYLIDGNLHFGITVDTARIQACWPDTLDAVIVGIGYQTDSVQEALQVRNHDLTPEIPQEVIDGGWMKGMGTGSEGYGGQAAYLQMIEEDVKPLVAANFPVSASDTILMGHSLGGLTTLAAMLTAPESFSNFAAISPSIWFSNGSVLEHFDGFAAKIRGGAKARLFMSTGEFEEIRPMRPHFPKQKPMPIDEAAMQAMLDDCRMITYPTQLARRFDEITGDHFVYRFVVHAEEDHRSVVPAGIAGGICFSLYRPD